YIAELGDASPAAQRFILNVLDQGTYRASGRGERPLTARIVASALPNTDRNDGSVLPALLSHLSVVLIRVPPLREYSEDVPELLRWHVDLLVDSEALPFRRFGVAAQNRLRNYPWPGNLRELKHLAKRLLILGGDEEI